MNDRKVYSAIIFLPLLSILALTACGGGGNNDESGPPPTNNLTPDLPQHNNLGDITVQSEPAVAIRPVSELFTPKIFQSAATVGNYDGAWVEYSQLGFETYRNPATGSFTGLIHERTSIVRIINNSFQQPALTEFYLPWKESCADSNGAELVTRPLLYDSGTFQSPMVSCTSIDRFFFPSCPATNVLLPCELTMTWDWSWPLLTNPPYIKRTAEWIPVAIDGDVTQVVSTGPSTQTFTSSITVGSIESTTNTFAESLTISGTVGVELSFIQASATIEKEVSTTFSNSISISEEETLEEQVTYPPNGVYRRWALQETYEFVNEDGSPYTDPSYEFTEFVPFIIKGTKDFIVDQIGSSI